jgi:hypothetical protein
MDGHSHRVVGAAVALAALPILTHHHGLPGVTVACAVAVATSSGRALSPDADQGWLWHLIDRVLPDEAILNDNGPMQHRGITHWWLWPVLAWLLSLAPLDVTIAGAGQPVTLSASPALAGVALGWGSHVLADFLVGARGNGRGPGVPLAPWWWWVGTGAKCDGVTEWAVTLTAVPAAGWWVLGHPGTGLLAAHVTAWASR